LSGRSAHYQSVPAGKNLIIVVDDDASVRKALERLLRAAGYKARTFATADELLNSDAVQDAACLIIDVGLPGPDGFELHRRLAGQGTAVPVIFVSGHECAERLQAEAMRRGAIAFLRKPFADRELLGAIEQISRLNRSAGRMRG
jgi:FixJ family two-component response regulator